jgi:hypothetical protein
MAQCVTMSRFPGYMGVDFEGANEKFKSRAAPWYRFYSAHADYGFFAFSTLGVWDSPVAAVQFRGLALGTYGAEFHAYPSRSCPNGVGG